MAVDMTWQLAIAVLVPIIGGVEIGKAAHAKTAGIFIGLGIAVLCSIVVLWRTLRVANQVPVPKLSEAQKREVQKQYESEDDD